jgi:hypothetical protein
VFSAAFVVFEIIRVSHVSVEFLLKSAQPWCGNVLLDQRTRGCSSFLALALAVSWATALRRKVLGPPIFIGLCPQGRGDRPKDTSFWYRDCMVAACVRFGASVRVRVMDCMCSYQVIRAWRLEQPRWRYRAASQPSPQLLLLLCSSRLCKCT